MLVSHRRPGFYTCGSWRKGWVEAGQEIEKVASSLEAMTVAEIDALLYLPDRSRRDFERALRIPANPDRPGKAFGRSEWGHSLRRMPR